MVDHLVIKKTERSLHLSTLEGMLYGAMQGVGEHFTAVYAVALGATNSQIAALVSLPQFLGAASQASAGRLARLVGGRKALVLTAAAAQGLMWLPILLIGLLPLGNSAAFWLIASLTLYTVFSAVTSVSWGSIMAEVVPPRIRGRYFSQRSRWSTLVNMAAFLAAGAFLYLDREQRITSFALVFGLAFLFRVLSVGLLTTLVEAPHSPKDDERVPLGKFLGELVASPLGRTILYMFCLSFVVNLASPFFTPYMLRDLEFNYLTFTLLELATIVAAILAVTHWGALADKAGNRRVMLISGILVSLVPLLWLVSGNVVWLGFAQFYSGVVWAGFNLASVNFIYDATTPRNRIAYLGYFSAGVGVATGLGALAGGVLIYYVPALLGSTVLSVFLVSGVLRLTVGALFLPHIREVRRVRAISSAELFHIMLGGGSVYRPAHHGRMHFRLHGHRDAEG